MAMARLFHKLADEVGIIALSKCHYDVYILLLTRFIRMFAYGSSTLILALYFAALGYSDTKIGLFMTLTLVGDVGISLALTLIADALGRRRILVLGALLMSLSGVVFATVSNYWLLLLAAIVGVISPSGNEIGPFRAIEESTIAHLSHADARTDIFAWYVVVGTLGTAGGSLGCGWMVQSLQGAHWDEIDAFRLVFWVYAAIGLLKAALSCLLSRACEPEPPAHPVDAEVSQPRENGERQPLLDNGDSAGKPAPKKKKSPVASLSPKSRFTLLRLCFLFFFDCLASGMVPSSLIALFMERKFGMPRGQLGSIISTASFVSSISNILASSIAKRIGLVQTMVFTHLPSAIFLALFPLPSSLLLTIVLLVARSSLSSMDQAPRSAFLSAVVLPEERTTVMGIVNTVKTMSQSSGPLITGVLAGSSHFWVAFVTAGILKASYDVGMLTMFVGTKLEGHSGQKKHASRDDDVTASAEPVERAVEHTGGAEANQSHAPAR